MNKINKKEQYIKNSKIKVSSKREIIRYIVFGLIFILLYVLIKKDAITLPNNSNGSVTLISIVFGIGMLLTGIIKLLFSNSVKLIKQARR